MKKQYVLVCGLAFVLFLPGCVCGMKEEVDSLRKENLSLRDAAAKKDIESALLKKDREMQIALLKKDAETQKLLASARIKDLEREISDRDAKLKNTVPVDLVFQSSDPYNYQFPSVLVDLWLSRNKPPKNAAPAQLRDFAFKLLPIVRLCSNSPGNQQRVAAVISELPETFITEMINADNGNNFSQILSLLAQRMDKQTLKRYFRASEGRPAHWAFANRFWQLADETDKELIMKYFWNNQTARQKAVKFGFHKEILPEIKKRLLDNFQPYPDLMPVVLPLLSAEEKELLSKKISVLLQNEGPNRNLWTLVQYAPVFLKMGDVPAFVQLGLMSPYIRQMNSAQAILIEKYSPVPLPKLQTWVLENYGNIVFDAKTQKFAAGKPKEKTGN